MASLTFLIHVEARPNDPESEHGGAFVLCWMVRRDLDEATADAYRGVADANWQVVRLEEAKEVTRDSSPASSLEYFDQAQLDGEVFVFHKWPFDAPDASDTD